MEGEEGKGRKRQRQQGQRGREGTASPFSLADGALSEEDSTNQGLDNNKASHGWFLTVAQTNHYTSLPTSSWGSQVSADPREGTRRPVACLSPHCF